MNRKYILGAITAAAVLVGGGIGIDAALSGNGGQSGVGYGAPSAVAPALGTGIRAAALAPGTALVDANGHTLYLFEADRATTSACAGGCAQVWPPLVTHGNAPTASDSVQAKLLGTTSRTDGTQQVTYNGHPLYYFAGDKAPGDVRGQGLNQFGASWYVVAPGGDKIDSGQRTGGGTGSGYGY
jgi:predicted lipoprotein with Yx(FWY)xxD motif